MSDQVEQLLDIFWLSQYSQSQPPHEPAPAAPAAAPAAPPSTSAAESQAAGPGPESPEHFQVRKPRPPLAKTVPPPGPKESEARAKASTALTQIRELRPLRAQTGSARRLRVRPEESARRSAEAGFSWLVLEPIREPLFRVVLIRDLSPTMVVWQEQLDQFEASLRILGPDLVTLTCATSTTTPQLRNAWGREIAPRELRESPGRQLVVLASDARGPAWSSPELKRWLALWAQVHPTSLLLLTPERLWNRTVLSEADWVQVANTHPKPGVGSIRVRERHWLDTSAAGDPLLVFTLKPASLRRWARFLNGQEALHPGLLLGDPVSPASADFSLEERLRRFLGSASPAARQMVGRLAAVPLGADYLRRLVPAEQSAHLAEILFSDLMEPGDLEFAAGVRSALEPELPQAIHSLRLVDDLLLRDYGVDVDQLLADPGGQSELWSQVPALAEFVPQIPPPPEPREIDLEQLAEGLDISSELALQRALRLADRLGRPLGDEELWRALVELHYEDSRPRSQALSSLYESLPRGSDRKETGSGVTPIALQVLADCRSLRAELGFDGFREFILPTALLRTISPFQYALQHAGWNRQHWQRALWKELAGRLLSSRLAPKPDLWLRWLEHPLAGYFESVGDALFWEVENEPASVRRQQNRLRQWAAALSLEDRGRAWRYLRQQGDWPPQEEILADQTGGFHLRLVMDAKEEWETAWVTADSGGGRGSYLEYARDAAAGIRKEIESRRIADGECFLLPGSPRLLVQVDDGRFTGAQLTGKALQEMERSDLRCLAVAFPTPLPNSTGWGVAPLAEFLEQLRARPNFRRTYFGLDAKDLGWVRGEKSIELSPFWEFLHSSESLKSFAGRLLPASEGDLFWVWQFVIELRIGLRELEITLQSARVDLETLRFPVTPQFALMILLYSVLDLSRPIPHLPEGVEAWLRNSSDFEDLTRPRDMGQPGYLPRVQWHPRLAQALEAAAQAQEVNQNLVYLNEILNLHQEVWPLVWEEEPAVRKLYLQLRARQLIHRLQTLQGTLWWEGRQVLDFFPDFGVVPASLFYPVPRGNPDLHQPVVEAQVGPEEGGIWRLLPMREELQEYGAQLADQDFQWLRAQQLLYNAPDMPDGRWRVWKLRDQGGNEFHLQPREWPRSSPIREKTPVGEEYRTHRGWTIRVLPAEVPVA